MSSTNLLSSTKSLFRYYPDIELCVSEMRGEQKAKEREQQKEKEEDYGDSAIGRNVQYK